MIAFSRLKQTRLLLLFLCLYLALQTQHCVYASEKPDSVSLTILYTNDTHGHLSPFDYDSLGKKESDVGGAARRATLIRNIKASAGQNVLVMDAGDIFARGPLDSLKGAPDFDVMNAIPYDIMTLGNEDFLGAKGAEGEKVLFDRIKQAKFTIVSANVFDKKTEKTIVPPYKIYNIGGIKVGVFGLTAPRVAEYEQAKGFHVVDPYTVAKDIVSELNDKCDFIIALTHINFLNDLALAERNPQIDVIIGGDSHTWLFEPLLMKAEKEKQPVWWVGGTVVCQDGEYGKCLGRLDLKLCPADGHHYKVKEYSGKLLNIDSLISPAKDIQDILTRAQAEKAKMQDGQ